MALSKEWVNRPQRRNDKLMKSMPKEIYAGVKTHRRSTRHGIFLRFANVDYGDFSRICLIFLSVCHTVMLFL